MCLCFICVFFLSSLSDLSQFVRSDLTQFVHSDLTNFPLARMRCKLSRQVARRFLSYRIRDDVYARLPGVFCARIRGDFCACIRGACCARIGGDFCPDLMQILPKRYHPCSFVAASRLTAFRTRVSLAKANPTPTVRTIGLDRF